MTWKVQIFWNESLMVGISWKESLQPFWAAGAPKPEIFVSKLDSQNQTIKLLNEKKYSPSVEASYDFEGSYELVSGHTLITKVSNGTDKICVTLRKLR